MKREIVEFCPVCEHEVKLYPIMFERQKCPKCGAMIKPCSMCDCDICDCAKCAEKYPYQEDDLA